MTWLKYYAEEQARQPELHAARCTQDEAERAIRKLSRHFKINPPKVRFTSGNRTSHAMGTQLIVLNVDGMTWLLIAHEFAHTWHTVRRREKQQALHLEMTRSRDPDERTAMHRRWLRMNRQRHHGKEHARLTDRACAYIVKQGWHTGKIGTQLLERAAARTKRTEEREAKASSYTARIAKRAAQVARLERKIKALTTRLKRARRSLAALTRAAEKAQGTS